MTTDPAIRKQLQEAWDWCAISDKPLALLAIEPDTSAALQDNAVLEHLQRALRVHCARDRDQIARPTPGTFLAILPDTTPPGARHVGEQIVEAMHHTPHNGATVSVGIAAIVPTMDGACEPLLTRATNALRAAQDQGGDRCLGASATPPPPETPLQSLRKLLQPPQKDEDHKRRTD